MAYPFTQEQLRLAASVDLPLFLEMRGEQLESTGREKKLIYHDSTGTHDSITMRGSRWYDHKNQQGGGPIQFMQIFSPTVEGKHTEFELPPENKDMHRVFAYLIKQRFIAPEIITHFAKAHTLYEDAEHHNAVFVGLDEQGRPVAAAKRSTSTYCKSFRMTCAGSDTRYSFAYFGNSERLYIFEAPIDLLSFLTLYPENWQTHSYIALNGLYETALLRALETHEHLNRIVLCTDNDTGGIDGAERLADILRAHGYSDIRQYVPRLKDWNELLKARHGVDALPAVPHRRKQIYLSVADHLPEIRCPPERLVSRMNESFRQKSYTDLAAYALAGAAFFAPGHDVRTSLKKAYRAYTDKAHMAQKKENLRAAMQDAVQMLRQKAYTELQRDQCVRSLMHLADCAVRMSTEIAMQALAAESCALCHQGGDTVSPECELST